MAKKNGTWKWVIGTAIAILTATATIVGSFIYDYGGHDVKVDIVIKDVAVMKPEVAQNTEHRHRFEEKVTNMDKKIDEIHKKVTGQ